MRVACLTFWFYDYTIQMANELARHAEVLLLLPDYRSEEYWRISVRGSRSAPSTTPDMPGGWDRRATR
ncbi:MAG: hypothetical protein RQM90_11850 [Methanoculleus sp.]